MFRASCLTHVSFLFLFPSQDLSRLADNDGQGFLFGRRTKNHKTYYFIHPFLLDREQRTIDMTAAWKANDNDPQLQHFPASVSVDLSQLCPTSPADDGEPRHKQWALRQASWDVNVVDGFPTRDHSHSDEWLPDDSPEWPSEDSEDYPSVLAARFLRLMDEYACLDGSGFKELGPTSAEIDRPAILRNAAAAERESPFFPIPPPKARAGFFLGFNPFWVGWGKFFGA